MSRIGEMLVEAGKIQESQLEEALAKQRNEGGRIGTHLVKMGFLSDQHLVEFLSQRYGVPAINLTEIEVDEGIIKIIPPDVARKYTILPVSKAGAKLTIAMVAFLDIWYSMMFLLGIYNLVTSNLLVERVLIPLLHVGHGLQLWMKLLMLKISNS